MAGFTKAQQDLIAEIVAAAVAKATASASTGAESPVSEASTHWTARDLTCGWAKPCKKTFRTVNGQTFHNTQSKHYK